MSWRNPATSFRCDGKNRYRNEQKAVKFARQASIRAGHPILEYQCPDCGFWHIGRAPRSQLIAHEQELERISRALEKAVAGPEGSCPFCTREKCCGADECKLRRKNWYRQGRVALGWRKSL